MSQWHENCFEFYVKYWGQNYKKFDLSCDTWCRNLAWTIRILLECLQHILKMYAWSLSENQASVKFKCRLIALMLKQSLFRKHDFAVWVYQIYHDYQNQYFGN